jgi:hypothetical protein
MSYALHVELDNDISHTILRVGQQMLPHLTKILFHLVMSLKETLSLKLAAIDESFMC